MGNRAVGRLCRCRDRGRIGCVARASFCIGERPPILAGCLALKVWLEAAAYSAIDEEERVVESACRSREHASTGFRSLKRR
jgi:hypothetical protein